MMETIEPYLKSVDAITANVLASHSITKDWGKRVSDCLNGGPNRVVREFIPISLLRDDGIFFTSAGLADRLLKIKDSSKNIKGYCDPACGVGDLLLACARQFDVYDTLSETLNNWGQRLFGSDLHAEFVHITKIRLTLLAIQRGSVPDISMDQIDTLLPGIVQANALKNRISINNSDIVVLNPPYSLMNSDKKSEWSTGKVSKAAVFLEHFLNLIPDGCTILAILPDVLRTGSRYKEWRETISGKSHISDFDIVGRFDSYTDVDVFIVKLVKTSDTLAPQANWWGLTSNNNTLCESIGEKFTVRVGPVVPFRDAQEGNEYKYITAKDLKLWTEESEFSHSRKYNGITHTPPLVVIKRTSSPSDRQRAGGTIILGNQPLAIENHLIVLTPKDGKVDTCRELIQVLRSDKTNEWLDNRIRCRHLTVSSIKELPWWTSP